MNIFFNIAGYELKKVMCKKRSVIVLTLVILISAFSVFGTIIGNYYYSDENGNEVAISRYEDEMIDRRNGEALSGRVIDADLIMEAVNAYKNIPIEGNKYTHSSDYQNNVRKYSEIYGIVRGTLNLSGVEEFRSLTREQAEQFDEIRKENRPSVISNSKISENMRAYWQKCLDSSPETLIYEYNGGYNRYIVVMYTTAVMAGAALAILFAGIFSGEYTSGADSLILSSKHGKGLVIGAKLFVMFAISVVLILFLMLISFVEAMIVWGNSGADAFLEIMYNIFPYPLTIGQSAAIYSVCIFAACLFISAITAMLSACFKKSFNTIVVMAVLIIVPMFIDVSDAPVWAYELFTLLPSNMMAFWYVMGDYQFELFGMVIPNYIFLPVFAAAASCLCSFLAYRVFKKHQIN